MANKTWHIVYTRFREAAAANGNWVFSLPIVTDVPRWTHPLENRMHEEGEDVTKDIESWRYMKGFGTREEAEAALRDFPIETWELLAHEPPLHIWKYADGREVWEKEPWPGEAVKRAREELDPMYRQRDRENEFGAYREPPAALKWL